MTSERSPLTLAQWRRTVAELYAAVRAAGAGDPARAAQTFRAARDRLFRTHADTPLSAEKLKRFNGLPYYPYDPAWRTLGAVELKNRGDAFSAALGPDGTLRFACIGRIHFNVNGNSAVLSLYWLEGYGGGLWLPFADKTNGVSTYGGGRYLYDTIKGADLGLHESKLVLDFNYAYNPSCAYDSRWLCALAPEENRLPFEINAGEQIPR